MDSTTQMLADCVIAWDLLDANDQPIPSTLEGLQDVDYVSQAALLQMITEDQQQSKPTGSEPSPVSFTDTSASLPIQNGVSPQSLNGTSSVTVPSGSASASPQS